MTRQGVRWFFSLLGLSVSGLVIGSAFGHYHWLLDVFSHFQLQFALLLSLCLVVLLVVRANRLFALFLSAALAFSLYLLAPFFIPSGVQASGDDLRLVAFNVHMDNQQASLLSDYLRQTDPDLIMLSEITPEMLEALSEKLNGIYPHVFDASARGTGGLAFLSKHPLEATRLVALSDSGRLRRALEAELSWQDRTVRVYGVHPLPPLGERWAERRNADLARLAGLVAQVDLPTVVLGDFNASPWSHAMQSLVTEADLRYASAGFGIWPTWRYGTLLFSAPIDHILLSDDWRVATYRVGRDLNSDHFPVFAELRLSQGL